MEPLLVESVTYILSDIFRDGERVYYRRRSSHARAKWFDARAFS
jgi:hypothetical protein